MQQNFIFYRRVGTQTYKGTDSWLWKGAQHTPGVTQLLSLMQCCWLKHKEGDKMKLTGLALVISSPLGEMPLECICNMYFFGFQNEKDSINITL